MPKQDWFTQAFGAGVADIRQKLVEEAWFGRSVTPRPLAGHTPDAAERSMAERMGWGQDRAPGERRPTPDIDIDR